MSATVQTEAGGKLVRVQLSGKLSHEDYQQFVPYFEQQIQEHGKIRILVELHDFHGWDMGALWDDLKFDMKHFTHIERLAMIGETAWEKGMAVFCKPFTTAKVRYFDHKDRDQAEQWISEGLEAGASSNCGCCCGSKPC
jgi:hypothetical protein